MTIEGGFLQPGMWVLRELPRGVLVIGNQVMQEFPGRHAEGEQHQEDT